jgi:ribonuclease P protein component
MAALSPPETFKQRADFLRLAARGRKLGKHGFVMQICTGGPAIGPRVGYTATKKIGNAVVRNRARRRLKEAARLTLAGRPLPGVEMVLICRQETASMPFARLRAGIDAALAESGLADIAQAGLPAGTEAGK